MSVTITTAVLAVLVFVLTQTFLKFVLEPIQDQRHLVGEVAHALVFYANVFVLEGMDPDTKEHRREEIEDAKKALRGLAGRLRASLWAVPLYDVLALLRIVLKKNDVLEASAALIGWSNSLYQGDREGKSRSKRRKIIADRLGITKRLGPY